MENQLLFLLLGNGLSAEVRRGNWRWESCREEGDTVALPGVGTAEETTLMQGWLSVQDSWGSRVSRLCVGGQAQSPRVQGAATGPQDTSANGPQTTVPLNRKEMEGLCYAPKSSVPCTDALTRVEGAGLAYHVPVSFSTAAPCLSALWKQQ